MKGNIPIPELPFNEEVWLMVFVTSVRERRTQQGKPFRDASARNATGNLALKRPVTGMSATPSGLGYWMVASDGGIFAFGDAPFLGSTGAITLFRPVVGMAGRSSGAGYWMAASDGGIFAFGDAQFAGSTGGTVLNQPVVGMAAAV